jgi:hypothetical protein
MTVELFERRGSEVPLVVMTAARGFLQPLIARGADPNVRHAGIGQLQGRTALLFATDNQQAEVVALLLDAGADVNVKDALGETALTLALESARLDVARLLVNRGGDVNTRNRFGRPALILAIEMLRPYSGMDESAADWAGGNRRASWHPRPGHPRSPGLRGLPRRRTGSPQDRQLQEPRRA